MTDSEDQVSSGSVVLFGEKQTRGNFRNFTRHLGCCLLSGSCGVTNSNSQTEAVFDRSIDLRHSRRRHRPDILLYSVANIDNTDLTEIGHRIVIESSVRGKDFHLKRVDVSGVVLLREGGDDRRWGVLVANVVLNNDTGPIRTLLLTPLRWIQFDSDNVSATHLHRSLAPLRSIPESLGCFC